MPQCTYYLAIIWTHGPSLLEQGDPTQATQPGSNEG